MRDRPKTVPRPMPLVHEPTVPQASVTLKSKRGFRKWVTDGLSILIATAVLLGLLEAMGWIYIHTRYGRPGKSYGIWQADRELGTIPRPNSYNSLTSLNHYGFRNREDVLDPNRPVPCASSAWEDLPLLVTI